MKKKPLERYLTINSLVGRFIVASLVFLPVFIYFSGTLLVNSFQHSQIKSEEEKLQAQLYLLLSSTEVDKQALLLPDALPEPRFNQQNSGLYGIIYSAENEELWRSPSASLWPKQPLHLPNAFRANGRFFSQSQFNERTAVNFLSHDIEWVDDNDQIHPLRFIVASDNSALAIELNSYKKRLWQWLSAMAILLIIAQLLIMKWGLKPLGQLSNQLKALQESKATQLDGNYPKEIQPVIENFNSILTFEKQQRERYRNTMSDLAHSLKTPLAVIQSQMGDNQHTTQNITEQLDRINQIISHQLKRAVVRVNHNAISQQNHQISVAAMTNRLINILDKVYKDKHIQFDNQTNSDITFVGDEADLLEVMGNLLDNACKYGNSAVVITAKYRDNNLCIEISDDGDGIPGDLQNTLLGRGARGDTAQAGQGIGLSVAIDIISSYGGGLEVHNNAGSPHLKGACFKINFPGLTNDHQTHQ